MLQVGYVANKITCSLLSLMCGLVWCGSSAHIYRPEAAIKVRARVAPPQTQQYFR